jgi:hypothetical protein
VVYQRRVVVTRRAYEPPETTTPELEEELTDPEVDERPLDEDESEVAFEVDELEELVEAVPDEVEAVVAVAPDDVVLEPGMVMALTVPKMATPATAAKAIPAVSRSSRDRALSRASIRASGVFVPSMLVRMPPASQSSL